MAAFQSMINLQLMLFALIAIGIFVRRKNIITASSRKNLTDLFIDIILPCNIINSFEIGLTRSIIVKCITILIVAFAMQVLYWILSKTLFIKTPHDKKIVLEYATICSNAGFMGNPIVLAVFGSEGFLYASIALIPLRIFMWSAGLSLFTKTSTKNVIKNLLLHPCIIAVYIGSAIMLTGVKLPLFLDNTIKSVGNCNTAISMIVIGTILAEINVKEIKTFFSKLLMYYSAIRLVVIPLLVFAILKIAHMDAMVIGVTVLLAAMPAGSTTAILAEKYGADSLFASKCIFISTLFSLFTIPLIRLIL